MSNGTDCDTNAGKSWLARARDLVLGPRTPKRASGKSGSRKAVAGRLAQPQSGDAVSGESGARDDGITEGDAWDEDTEVRELRAERKQLTKEMREETNELRKTTRSMSPPGFRRRLPTLP